MGDSSSHCMQEPQQKHHAKKIYELHALRMQLAWTWQKDSIFS